MSLCCDIWCSHDGEDFDVGILRRNTEDGGSMFL
jgi:hypothetical protein